MYILLLILVHASVIAQEPKINPLIDSLEKELNKPNIVDTAKIQLVIAIAEESWNLRLEFWDSIINISQEALNRVKTDQEKISLQNSMVKSYNNLGYIHLGNGDADLALEQYDKVKELVDKTHDKDGLASYYGSVGVIHLRRGEIPLALDCYHKSLKLREELGDKWAISNSLNNLGYIYDDQDDPVTALKYYERSLKLRREVGDKKGISTCLNNIGQVHNRNADYDKAMEFYQESLKIREEIGNKRGIATCLTNIGNIYRIRGDLDLAMDYHARALKLREETGDKKGVSTTNIYLASVLLEMGKTNEALKYAEQGYAMAEKIGYPKQISNSARILSEIYEQLGKSTQALAMFKLYVNMDDSLKNEATQKATMRQQAQYEFEKAQALRDIEHENLIEIEHKEQEKQKIFTGAFAAVLILVIVFLFFVFNRLRVTKKQKLLIEEQKEIVEEAHQEIKDSIAYAKRIQSAILPSSKEVKQSLPDSFILYIPKDVVAGDFYWLEHVNNVILFAAADCTGHGVPGAMVSVVCNNALNRSVREHGLTNPGDILDKTRELIIDEFEKSEDDVKDGMDIALCSLEGTNLQFAGANNPLYIIRKGELIEYKADKQPIGQFDNPTPYQTHHINLEKGDTIYVFTDGYLDQFGGEKGKKFKAKPFKDLLLSVQDKSMQDQLKIINDSFELWKGNLDQIDDVCLIGVRI